MGIFNNITVSIFLSEQSLVSSMADLVHEVIPQGQTPLSAQNEVIHWVDVKKLEYGKNNKNLIFELNYFY